MASFPDLRPGLRSAKAGSRAVRRFRLPVLLAALAALLLTASLAVSELATLRGAKAHDASAFLTRELGSPLDSAPLVRRPARRVEVKIDRRSYGVAYRQGAVSLAGLDTGVGTWNQYTHGVSRRTVFGRETITVSRLKTEQYLTVERRQGEKTWRWKLASPRLRPLPTPDGGINFALRHAHSDGHKHHHGPPLSELRILPPAILDARGRDITPDGLAWSFSRHGSSWWLELDVDDADLPLPYVIDPAITFRSAASTGGGGEAYITIATPAGVAAGDFLIAQITHRAGAALTITPPDASWNLIRSDSNGATITSALYYKVATSAEPASYTWNFSAGVKASGGIIAYQNVNNGDPIDVTSAGTGNSMLVTAPTATTNTANTMVVGFFSMANCNNGGDYWTPPVGMTERYDVNATGAFAQRSNSEGADVAQALAGATGPKSAVPASSGAWIGQLVALKVDVTPPTSSLSVTEGASPNLQYFSGGTFYYNPIAAGNFTLVDAASDGTGSGVASVAFPAISPAVTGFTGAGNTDTTAPYDSTTYSFDATNVTAPTPKTVTVTDYATNSTNDTVTFVRDTSGPGAFALTAPAAGATIRNGQTVSAAPSDGAGIRQVEVRYCSGGSCTWAAGTTIGSPDTTSPYSVSWTSQPADGTYTLIARATDNVDNWTDSSTRTVTVDNTAPTQSLALTGVSPAGTAYKSGSTVYYRASVAGSFQLRNTVTDSPAGAASSTTSPLAGSTGGWSHTASTVSTPAGGPYDSNSFSWAAGTATSPTVDVTAADNAGNTSAATTLTFTNDTTAPSVTAPTLTAGYYTSLSVPVALNGGSDGGSGLAAGSSVVQRDEATLSGGSCGSFSGSWTTITLSAGNDTGVQNGKCYQYREQLTDNVGNTGSSSPSATAKVDNAGPSNALTLTGVSPAGSAFKSGTTIYYRGVQSGGGSFKLRNAVADGGSGAASSQTAALGGTTTGWTHTSSTVSTPAGGPFDSNDFTWAQGTTSSPTEAVTGRDGAGNATTSATHTFVNDSTAPAGGALTVNGTAASSGGTTSYDSDGSFTIGTRSDYAETQSATESGLASSTLVREAATLSADSCGAFGSSTTISGNPDQSGLATGCYRYTLTGTDNVGNSISISTTVKVDTSPPTAPALSFANISGAAYHSGSGTRVFFRPSADNGSFDVTASSTDGDTVVASYSLPTGADIGTNWSASGSGATRTYSYTAGATTNGSQNVSATNAAGGSVTATFEVTADSTAPGGGALTVNGTAASAGDPSSYDTDGSFPIDLRTDYSETASATESGLSSSTLVRTSATFSATDTCGAFGSATTLAGNPDQNGLTTGCYRYTLSGTDNVGNRVSISTTVKVDTSAPSAPSMSFANVTGGVYYAGSGSQLFFRPSAASGGFDITASSSDADTGISGYSFPTAGSMGTNWSASGSGASRTYSFTPTAGEPGTKNVSASNNAGGSASSSFTVTADSSAPTGEAITLTGATAPYFNTASVTFALTDGIDGSGSGLDTSTRTITRETGTLSGGNCSGFTADAGTFTSPDNAVAGGNCYRYTFTIADNVGNVSAAVTATAKVDTDAPSITVTAPTELTGAGNQYYDAGSLTHFFRPSGSGSFALTATASDSQSDIAQVAFPDVSSVGGWSGSTGGADTTGPYSSPVGYTWSSGATAPGLRTLVATNGASIDGSGTITLAADATAPTGQTITLTGANAPYYGSASVSFTLGDGADGSGSGLDTSSRTVTRETGDLAGDSCSNFTADAGTFTSPDTAVSGGHCYRYTFTIADNVGNVSTGVSVTAKVDTQAPSVAVDTPTELTGAGNQHYVAASKTLFFRSSGSGSFRLNSTSSDAHTAVASVAYPGLSGVSGWSTNGTDSSWSSGAAEPGARSISATDSAGNSASDTITITDDTTAATGQTITLTGALAPYYGSAPVTFSLANGSDTGSGIDPSSATVTRETATLAGDSCASFTADAGTFTSPDTAVSGGHCYRYTFTIADNVGNVSSAVTATAKVDTDDPSVSLADPGTPLAGTVALGASASDGATAVQQVVFERAPAGGSTWTTIGSDSTPPYTASWDTTAVADGDYDLRAVATDKANRSNTSLVASRRVDNTPPQTTIDSSPPDPSSDDTPTFTFSSSEAGSTFQCRVDGASWASCTSPHTLASLANGSHTFDVRATDPADNTDPTPATYTWMVDLTVPDTTIDSNPSDPSNDPTPTFSFSSSQSGSAFTCRVDGASWATCTSPHTLAALAEGSHTFDVRASDAAGNTDSTPASYTWAIDAGAPTVTITAPTVYVNGSDPLSYPVTASTPDTDVTRVDFYECSDASSGCSTGSWIQFGSDSTAPYSATWSTPAFDGAKAIRAVAVDAATNTGQHVRTITIDRTAPSGVTVSYPNGYVFGSFAITPDNGPDPDVDASSALLERRLGDLAADSCSSYAGWSSATSPDTLASGKCAQYRYRVADNAGNWATATSSNEVKSDTAAPTSSQDDPGANLRQTVTLTATAGDTGGSGIASVAFQQRPAGGSSWTTIASDTSSPYSVSFDTTTVSDGLYDFRTVATDAAGNTEASPVVLSNRRIDNTPPGATMLSPGNPVRATVALSSNTSDAGSGIDIVSYELAPNGGSFNSQPASWDTTLSPDGLYDLRVLATDVAGNSTTSSAVTTRVDNTPPALTFSSPASGAVVSGTVNLVASASDASPASPPVSFAYKLHSDPPSAYTATGAAWNTTALPAGDGLYDLRAVATDDAANDTTVENTSIRVDNVPPSVAITAPPTAINGSVPSPTTFSANASDTGGSGVTQVQFFECSNQSTDCATGVWSPLGTVAAPGPYGVSWTIPGTDGNHALAAVATDNAGHPASAIRNVDVDRTAPNTTIVTKPADPSNNTTPTFTFSSSETGSTFECKIDGGSFAPCTSPHNVTGLSDNEHTFEVRATDPAGNTDATPDTWTWHRDTNAPSGTLNNPGANIRLNVTLTSSENDLPANGYASGLASVSYEYSANGTTWAPIGTLSSAPFDSIIWNTTGVTDGVYQLHIVVRDVAGNETTSAAVTNVRIDNTPPTTSQNDPGQYLRATKTLTASAADSGSGIDHVDFQRAPTGGGSWTTIGTDSTPADGFQVDFDTTGVSDGHYDFRTVAYDVAGNQAASGAVTDRLVDNTPPDATMNNPGAYLRGTVNLTSSTSDPGGTNASGVVSVAYEYSTNGGSTWQSTGASFNSTSVPDGNVSLHVTATDAAGNSTTSAAFTSLADNTKPVTTDNAPSGWQSSAVTVTLSASDGGSGVNVTEYSVDGNPTYTVGASVTIPAPADGSNDGAHTIAYFSVDNAGNIETVKSMTVLIDATPPACPSCSAADYLRGTVTLSASPTESGSGIQSVAFEYTTAGGSSWTTIDTDTTGPAPYTADWDTAPVADGHYDLRIRVTDNADNVTTTNLPDKVVDNTAPDVALVGAPTEGQLVTGTVAITASASDVTSPVASVQFFVRGSLLGTDPSAPFSLNWDTTTGADGAATIQVVVADMAGNTTSSPVRNVYVDNVSPMPTLADPGQYLSGTVSLSASSDPDTTQVDFERRPAGGGSWVTIASDTTLPWDTSLDTNTLSDGLYDFRTVATDQTGNAGASAIERARRQHGAVRLADDAGSRRDCRRLERRARRLVLGRRLGRRVGPLRVAPDRRRLVDDDRNGDERTVRRDLERDDSLERQLRPAPGHHRSRGQHLHRDHRHRRRGCDRADRRADEPRRDDLGRSHAERDRLG
jgi:hypothetical protein